MKLLISPHTPDKVTNGDSYKRVKAEGSDTHYKCGCYWSREEDWGDVMNECPIHKAATAASLAGFERRVREREDRG